MVLWVFKQFIHVLWPYRPYCEPHSVILKRPGQPMDTSDDYIINVQYSFCKPELSFPVQFYTTWKCKTAANVEIMGSYKMSYIPALISPVRTLFRLGPFAVCKRWSMGKISAYLNFYPIEICCKQKCVLNRIEQLEITVINSCSLFFHIGGDMILLIIYKMTLTEIWLHSTFCSDLFF